MPETSDMNAEETKSIKLYNMLLSCVDIGHALNTFDNVKVDLSGT